MNGEDVAAIRGGAINGISGTTGGFTAALATLEKRISRMNTQISGIRFKIDSLFCQNFIFQVQILLRCSPFGFL